MPKPTFFVIGAPKCGTTSMTMWLREHPNVFIPLEKEPHFFNDDDRRGYTELYRYEALFSDARPEQRAIGEGSVWYLSSSTAVINILQYQPNARFIVMIRNPIQMAPSLHAQMVVTGHENVRDFGTAWLLQDERRQGHNLPTLSWSKRRLLYGDICSLGAQLRRLLQIVPREQVLVVLLDDIREDARREYLKVLRFLGVPDDDRRQFPVYNEARVNRLPRLARCAFVAGAIKSRLGGLKSGLGLLERFEKYNQISERRIAISEEFRAVLERYFSGDIQLLERLVGRDLSYWFNDRLNCALRQPDTSHGLAVQSPVSINVVVGEPLNR
jgi:hypothetical protein